MFLFHPLEDPLDLRIVNDHTTVLSLMADIGDDALLHGD